MEVFGVFGGENQIEDPNILAVTFIRISSKLRANSFMTIISDKGILWLFCIPEYSLFLLQN